MATRRARVVAIAGLLGVLAGCLGGRSGGSLDPDMVPYSAARPAYTPPPRNPMFISGYAGAKGRPRPNRDFGPAPVVEAGPGLLP
jgi:hypothetical protein